MAVPILTRRLPAPARQARPQGPPRSPKDRLADVLAAAAGVWAAAALVFAVLLALAVTVALVLVAGLAIAGAASYHEPRVRLGASSTGEFRKARHVVDMSLVRAKVRDEMTTNSRYSNTF